MDFHTAILRQPQAETPQLAVFSFANLIDQVERNLECISGDDLKKDINSLQFLEAYFNESLECIRRAVLKLASDYERYGWREIL
jgi:hypothetical protein